ncbi:hypothetical protein VP01_2020g1 [Puccinia sorghi]|uniref:Uncharacterized protein n=1 Tax=Puccinia sorghi TaxID=27349 RepID=A0A0L6VD00_9BASI|nr:hypothetical protein VP01_2020g1 [Puccinia sorghi]
MCAPCLQFGSGLCSVAKPRILGSNCFQYNLRYYSLANLVVCDAQRRIIYYLTGWLGLIWSQPSMKNPIDQCLASKKINLLRVCKKTLHWYTEGTISRITRWASYCLFLIDKVHLATAEQDRCVRHKEQRVNRPNEHTPCNSRERCVRHNEQRGNRLEEHSPSD